MAVSYLSKPLQDTPYVIPFDLNLMAKVNQYKQSIFYKNADNLKNYYGQLKNTDILNREAESRFNNGFNSVIKQINDVGAIDYSDMGIANQLEGLGSQLYDDLTIKHIGLTRNARSYMVNTEKIKNDPKLSKYYDASREVFDTENYIKPYIGGKIDDNYEIPSAPKPYLGNEWDYLSSKIKEIRPDITVKHTNEGSYFINTTTNERVDKGDIIKMLDGRIDGAMADQMNVHAWYNYHYLTGGKYTEQEGLKEILSTSQNLLSNEKETLKNLEEASKVSLGEDKIKIDERIKYIKEQSIPYYEKSLNSTAETFSDYWNKNRNSAYYMLYKTKLLDNIGDVYSYEKQGSKLSMNYQQAQRDRVILKAFEKGYNVAAFDPMGNPVVTPLLDASGNPVNFGENNKNKDSKNSNKPEVLDATYNKDKPKVQTLKEFNTAIENLQQTSSGIIGEYLPLFAKQMGVYDTNDGLGFELNSSTDPSKSPTTVTSDLISYMKSLGKDAKNLEKQDIDELLQKLKKGTNGYTLTDNLNKTYALTEKGYNYFTNIKKYFDDYAEGKLTKETIEKTGVSMSLVNQMLNKYEDVQYEIDARQGYIKTIIKDVFNREGLSQKDYDTYVSEAMKNGTFNSEVSKINQTLNDKSTTGSSLYNFFKKITGNSDIDDKVTKEIEKNIGSENNTYIQYLTYIDDFAKTDPSSPLIAKIKNNAKDDKGNPITKIENISIAGVRKNDNNIGYKLNYTYGLKGTDDTNLKGSIDINENDAISLGFPNLPNPNFEQAMRYLKESRPIYKNTVDNNVVKFTVSNLSNDRNKGNYVITFNIKGEPITIPMQNKGGFNTTANAARYWAETQIAKESLESLYKKLKNESTF